ncbi:Fructan beta-fructosidase [Vibrio scophthalmi]|uniref:glycoside hydrolase family 32 protein n=2 Tax=Vibrionaceae TaxID=641 RepID=UPI0008093AE7|nr:glycoside hydrolase family 32 protein [Vibrio parahaemolyticus]ANS87816.1 Fructan beta-fructosidase [Vibrio scophthalmi]MCR9807781.1 glycoside hydrolase family 32 protein [Vibrio parahaemolyticus]
MHMQQLTKDIFRPAMHFTPPFGWMNDPNGLVYVNNEYHLFYQFYPYANKWGPMHWGHAVSADLRNWQHLPPALVPDEKGMCFSGSAVVDWRNTSGLFDNEAQPGVLAFYTACIAHDNGRDSEQMQSLAYSKDGGFSWNKLADNPILPNPGLKDFRDPKVIWHEQSQYWVMVVTEGQEVGFYRSKDLNQWEKTANFGSNEGKHDEMPWECPDLFPIQLEGSDVCYWVLIVGVQRCSHAGGSGTQYFIGQFDGERFTNHHDAETVLWLDYGRDYYAAQTWSDVTDGSRTSIAWMSNWLYANDVPTQAWRSAMSVPRDLKLSQTQSGLRLLSSLPKQWLKPQSSTAVQEKALGTGDSLFITQDYQAGVINGELVLSKGTTITLAPLGNECLIYTLQRLEEGYRITSNRTIDVEGEENYQNAFCHEVNLDMPETESIQFTAVIDRCSSELLLQDGEFCITDLSFAVDVSGFQFRCLEGEVTVTNLSFVSNDDL